MSSSRVVSDFATPATRCVWSNGLHDGDVISPTKSKFKLNVTKCYKFKCASSITLFQIINDVGTLLDPRNKILIEMDYLNCQ